MPSSSPIPPRGLFVTGTGTDVGKTFVASLLARKLCEQGVRVGVYKPAASGGQIVRGRVVCDDAVELWEGAGRPRTLEDVCPQMFEAPLAPHLAARAEGRVLDEDLLVAGLSAWHHECDFMLVEGAGGFLSPLGTRLYNADVAARIGYPLVIVVPNRLGMINDALQTIFTVTHYGIALRIAGWVVNHPSAPGDDLSQATNVNELRQHTSVPLLAIVPHGANEFPGSLTWLEGLI